MAFSKHLLLRALLAVILAAVALHAPGASALTPRMGRAFAPAGSMHRAIPTIPTPRASVALGVSTGSEDSFAAKGAQNQVQKVVRRVTNMWSGLRWNAMKQVWERREAGSKADEQDAVVNFVQLSRKEAQANAARKSE